MKRRTKVILIWAAVVFGVLFGGRLTYDLVRQTAVSNGNDQFDGVPSAGEVATTDIAVSGKMSFRGNYASSRTVVREGTGDAQVLDQKYERIAQMRQSSTNFDGDTQQVRAIVSELKGVIQQENASGLVGSRVLRLSIGVVPTAFEMAVEKLRSVGKLLSITVTKTDRTNDFRALEAKRTSLQKTRDGLQALRRPTANLADLMALETKILEIEGQIQDLGVSLGAFDETNSLCTVQVSLQESTRSTSIDLVGALFEALTWSVPMYLGLVIALLAAVAFAVLIGVLFDRIRTWYPKAEAAEKPKAVAPRKRKTT